MEQFLATHGLVVEPLELSPDNPLDGPATLGVAEVVELALSDPPEADLLEEIDPRVSLQLVPSRGLDGVKGVGLTSGVLVI